MSDEAFDAYQRDGIVSGMVALDRNRAKMAYANYEAMCDQSSGMLSCADREFGHINCRWIAEILSDQNILRYVKPIVGSDVLVWVSEFNAKLAFSSGFYSWHQDMYYWNFKNLGGSHPYPITTAWIALSDVTDVNGGMRVKKGSHIVLADHREVMTMRIC